MSKLKPEVGDVWLYKKEKYHVIESGMYNDFFDGRIEGVRCVKKGLKKIEGFKTKYFAKDGVYLGKSKAKQDDLFEVVK